MFFTGERDKNIMKILKKISIYCVFTLFVCFFSSNIFAFEVVCPEYEKGNFFYYSSAGILHQINNDSFVISDKVVNKSSSVSYHGLKARYISVSEFKKGCVVGYKLNNKNEVTDIYLIKKASELSN